MVDEREKEKENTTSLTPSLPLKKKRKSRLENQL
jgi:hypothetical protein